MRLFLAALTAALFTAGTAAADDSALNKEGRWTVGRGEAEATSCMASISIGDTAMLMVVARPDGIDVALGTKSPMRKGKQGVLALGDQRFPFQPDYGDGRDLMFLNGVGAPALDALRKTRWASVMVDGREVAAVDLDRTGVEGAMDGVVACSRGESGWWGPGLAAQPEEPSLVYQREGDAWGIVTGGATCLASAGAPDDRQLQLPSVMGRIGIAVGSTAGALPKGRTARVVTDSYSFEFPAEYSEGATYMNSADLLESADAFALRRAKSLRIVVDGRNVLDVAFEDDSFLQIIDAVTACSRGERGWWGEGAKPAS